MLLNTEVTPIFNSLRGNSTKMYSSRETAYVGIDDFLNIVETSEPLVELSQILISLMAYLM